MRLNNIKRGLIALCLTACAACSTPPQIIKSPILCPQVAECGRFSPPIRTNGELAEAYQQTQHRLNLCVIENDSLKKCIEDFNQKEQNQ
ncbi:Rz1-like lysis system protein LysC [Rodentibacter myodis]|uniref:Rz1-like lysis system protein LysC n=1 Tax=Rodentibacter myodis TaxID=1907939 RepID=UPI0009877276|nr:Rz1-like lysis system protein LysC [Rodentibacter myodis]